MAGDATRIGFVHAGARSDEQRAALSWLAERPVRSTTLTFADLADGAAAVDALWWHRDAPVEADTLAPPAADAVGRFLDDGGGLVLTLRAMAAVETLGVDPVPPDAVGVEGVSEPTGVLWRRLYDDHRAVAGFETLRVPVCDRGAVPTARYERVLPERGEVLAGTVRGERDVPGRMTVVSWAHRGGPVLGVGAPLAFGEPADGPVADARETLAAGCLAAVTAGRDGGATVAPRRPKTGADLRAMRARLADDHHRPGYHFTPPANWLNDPNGLVRWNGRYHLFYQYNPAGPFHGTIHWGHAVSDDLRGWTDEPVALAPSPDGPDRDGCWSGCAVDDDGTATLLYTGGADHRQLPCLATSDDRALRTWTKHADNPVIEAPPADLDVLATDDWAAEFRDHCVWRDGAAWHQLIGSGVADRGGAVLRYTSPNLRDWEYEGTLLVGDDGHGTVWECPELLDLDGADLLHVSDYERVRYFLGELGADGFAVERRGCLDHGDFYAPQSLDDGDRSLTWGWLPETRETSAQWDAGWSGALSLPRVLSVGADGRLRQRPAPEVTDRRARRLPAPSSVTLDAGDRLSLDEGGTAVELDVEVSLDDASAFELSVFESADRAERTAVRYTREGDLVVDRSASGRVGSTEPQRMSVPPYDEPLSLRAFLDGSVVELYANDRRCLTSRVYPGAGSTGISLAAEGGRATVSSLAAWALGHAVHGGPESAADRAGPGQSSQ